MFEGDFADTWAETVPLVSRGGGKGSVACLQTCERTFLFLIPPLLTLAETEDTERKK